jgi:PAS domain S-box-containing protein
LLIKNYSKGVCVDIEEVLKLTKKLHVLFAEDSLSMRKATSNMIKPLFKHLETAVDGADAFSKYMSDHETRGQFFDIVITDIVMPNEDGLMLSSKIKDCNPSQHIIVTSSENDLKLLINLLNLGVTKFVAKPIQKEAIVDVIGLVAQDIYKQHLLDAEQEEIREYNEILKKREVAQAKLYSDFYDALNETSIISKADLNGNITFANELFCKITKYSEDELLGKNYRMLKNDVTPSSFYSKLWNTITNQKSYKTVFKNKNRDGDAYYIEQVIKPIIDINGETIEYITIANDVTRLFKSIKKETEARESADQFFRNVGHEMRTPLNAIIGIAPFLKKKLKDSPKLLEMFDVIDESSKNLHKLVENVLDIQKLNAGELKTQLLDFDPVMLIQTVTKSMEHLALEKNQHFTVDIQDKSYFPLLVGDEKHIHAVMEILIDNAIKFTPNEGDISCRLEYDNNLLIFKVEDTGIGIHADDQEKIFTLTQLDGSISRNHEGTGMGLYLAANLLKILNGKIRVKSIPTQGSIFTVEIPCQTTKQQ